MSLPIAPAAKKKPSRQPTHRAIDHARLLRLGSDVEDEADEDTVDFALIDRMAVEQGIPHSHLYAGVALTTELTVEAEAAVQVAVCVGHCQQWGALECIDALADARIERGERGAPTFDILPKECLDACEHAAAVKLRTPAGTALIPAATPAALVEAVETALDE